MIKVETIGMLDTAKINPVIKADKEVNNYAFLTVDNDLYLISNTLTGDNAYKEGVTFAKGEYLNGYLVKAWEGQKLVVDGKHVTGGVTEVSVGDIFVASEDGTLVTGEATGVHFVVTDKTTLTEPAVKVKVVVA